MDGLDKTRIVLPGGRGELAIETEEEAQAADARIDAASRRLREHEKPDLGGWTGGGGGCRMSVRTFEGGNVGAFAVKMVAL